MSSVAEYLDSIHQSAEIIKERLGGRRPEIAIILGSGLGGLAEKIEDPIFISYGELPAFPRSTVAGHKGRFVVGKLGGKEVLCMQGRFHFYEGYHLRSVTLPIRVMQVLGIHSLVVTNAAGGVNESFSAGDLMLIEDHLNLTGQNPNMGENLEEFGPRFHDMTAAYDREYQKLAAESAAALSIGLQRGVYAWMTGPSFETPAEIRYLRTIGASAVGMSTVPEVIVARHSGIRVLGISCITNMAAGITGEALSHEEVNETADRVKTQFEALVTDIVSKF